MDAYVPTILKMPFLAIINLKIDWQKCKVIFLGKLG